MGRLGIIGGVGKQGFGAGGRVVNAIPAHAHIAADLGVAGHCSIHAADA